MRREMGADDRAPVMHTSSGLGDALVVGPRLRLFETIVNSDHPTARQQDVFHYHAWPGKGELSVRMNRPDARTVSITTIALTKQSVQVHYADLRPLPVENTVALSGANQ